jgi:hypothetical protein
MTDIAARIVAGRQVTPDNVIQLFEEIELSKLHYKSSTGPNSDRGVEVDGLTLLERGLRQVALFGDWIVRDTNGHLRTHGPCPAGLMPLGDGPVEKCMERPPHRTHRTAAGEAWTDAETEGAQR